MRTVVPAPVCAPSPIVTGATKVLLDAVRACLPTVVRCLLMRLMLDSSAERAGSELATQPQVRAAIERTIAQSYAAISEQARSAEHFAAAREAATKANLPVGERARLLMGQASALGGLSRFAECLTKLAESLTGGNQ